MPTLGRRSKHLEFVRHISAITLLLATEWIVVGAASVSAAECRPGIYGEGGDVFVVIGPKLPAPASGQRYLFRDGRRGETGSTSIVACDQGMAAVKLSDGRLARWPRLDTQEKNTTFESDATRLGGRLIEPPGAPDPKRPLVIMVHGSEATASLENPYAYMLVAQGVSVFAYDKRGTGGSEGIYSQNFELLADDAAAALRQARQLAAGRFARSGFFGGSQGGWVAPLAATRSPADFVVVGFGLVVSPVEEDREQLLDEARQAKLDAHAVAQVEQLSRATSVIVRSHFETGYENLARVRQAIGSAPWATTIKGEYSGDMLRMTDADLKRIGRARFDNLGLIWDYDATSVLKKLKPPLLWILAGEDREAPIPETRTILQKLIADGRPVEAYVYPDTDHGIFEFRTNPDGSRTPTRIANGYLRLIADWMKQDMHGTYGRAVPLR